MVPSIEHKIQRIEMSTKIETEAETEAIAVTKINDSDYDWIRIECDWFLPLNRNSCLWIIKLTIGYLPVIECRSTGKFEPLFDSVLPIHWALNICNNKIFAMDDVGDLRTDTLRKDADWKSLKATPKQRLVLKNIEYSFNNEISFNDEISRGEACNVISWAFNSPPKCENESKYIYPASESMCSILEGDDSWYSPRNHGAMQGVTKVF